MELRYGQGDRRSTDRGSGIGWSPCTDCARGAAIGTGASWDGTEAARPRLNSVEPIYWLVARSPPEMRPYVLVVESSYYSGMYIDAELRLQRVDPALTAASIPRQCTCCTHTFNGLPFPNHSVL